MFRALLIANRGEIACRIMRTAKRMGVRTVAVHSDADARALHVRDADQAVRIGPAPARDSYLNIAAVIDAAQHSGAEAVHPGYGFLSENADFADACAAAGLIFVGPPASAIRAMGSKSAAKARMAAAGVPVTPGYHGAEQSDERLTAEAQRIGYPVLVKASAGGGGKGMKIANAASELADALASARREAKASFGDDTLLVEKYMDRPRHIEAQVFADAHGNCIHLFERDCSIQRRHQKVIEEAPAPGLDQTLREALGQAAVTAAKTVGYVGAGTIEFLLGADNAFYFMEMNTRLQVEHPVTEAITGLDLVEWQLRVAAGEPLPLSQTVVHATGHAIEARIYAEDAGRGFLPQAGKITHLRLPAPSTNVRVDAGVAEGDAISTYYDPMIAKLIVWDGDRERAIARLRAALAETAIAGLVANVPFLARIAGHPAFAEGEIDTGFIARHETELLRAESHPDAPVVAALGLIARAGGGSPGPWDAGDGWRLNGEAANWIAFATPSGPARVEFVQGRDCIRLADGRTAAGTFRADGRLEVTLDGRRDAYGWTEHRGSVTVFMAGAPYRFDAVDVERSVTAHGASDSAVRSPMPGRIIAVSVGAGATVEAGQPLAVLEAMKMEHVLRAPRAGKIGHVACAPGDQVAEGAELFRYAQPSR